MCADDGNKPGATAKSSYANEVPDCANAQIEALRADWLVANTEYEACFESLIATQTDAGCEPSEEHKSAVRACWRAEARLLNLYVRALVGFNHALEPAPYNLLFRLALVAEDLGDGIIPDVVEFSRVSGRPYGRSGRNEISRAVFYLLAVEGGLIAEDAPIKTVAQCFNVTKQTVRNWRSRADEFCRGQEMPHTGMIEESMRLAGYRYARRGRGAPSV